MRKYPLRPYNNNKVHHDEAEDLFREVVNQLREVSRPLVDRMSFRDLYDFMMDAAVSAVGDHVRDRANGVSKGPSLHERRVVSKKTKKAYADALKSVKKTRGKKPKTNRWGF